jgi:signal transduction histidine kinase
VKPPANWKLATSRGRRSTILIVDDEPANVLLLEQSLKRAGYEHVISVTDPRTTEQVLEENQPDLILLDLRMPYVDGYQLLARWTDDGTNDSTVPIVVLTADTASSAKRRCLDAGASDVLTKPFDHVEVLLRIRNLLEVQALHSELKGDAERLERAVADRTSELSQSLQDLKRVDTDRRRLLASLVNAQEEERQRIAIDLHDDPIQKMTALAFRLESLQRRLNDPASREAIEVSLQTARSMIDRLRNLLFLLRPPALDESGLAAAITELLDRVGRDTGLRHHIHDALTSEPQSDVRAAAYRITQEAVTNVGKHAQATTLDVELESKENGVFVQIRDDGVGLPADLEEQPGHLGLRAMAERAQMIGGWWRFGNVQDQGTAVEFWLPNHALKIPA